MSIAEWEEKAYSYIMIRPAGPSDSAAICGIYNHYVENTAFTFEEASVPPAEMEERIRRISAKYPYLVLEDDGSGEVNGYAYANTWRERSAYRFAAEISIYVRDDFRGKGMGRRLMERLLEEIRKRDIHSLVAGIALPNERSVALHEKFGFRKVAHFEEIGFKFGKWLDVGYWELILKQRP